MDNPKRGSSDHRAGQESAGRHTARWGRSTPLGSASKPEFEPQDRVVSGKPARRSGGYRALPPKKEAAPEAWVLEGSDVRDRGPNNATEDSSEGQRAAPCFVPPLDARTGPPAREDVRPSGSPRRLDARTSGGRQPAHREGVPLKTREPHTRPGAPTWSNPRGPCTEPWSDGRAPPQGGRDRGNL